MKGGVLKGIRARFPKVLGYPPEMSPVHGIFILPVAERLVDWDEKGNFVPDTRPIMGNRPSEQERDMAFEEGREVP